MNIRDIARLADVSITTVSKIFNNKDNNISPVTREKVLKIAEQYNYSPYSKAIKKAAAKTKTIGIMVPDVSNKFYSNIIKHLEINLSEKGYGLILCNVFNDAEKEKNNINLLISKRVECVVFFYDIIDNSITCDLTNYSIPFFTIFQSDKSENSLVSFNLKEAMNEIFLYLYSNGFDRISLFVDENDWQLKGYYKRIIEANKRVYDKSLVFEVNNNRNNIFSALDVLIKTGTKAIIAQNIEIAQYIYYYAFEKSYNIPEDLSIVAFDDTYSASSFIPELCSFRFPFNKISEKVANIALSMINNETQDKQNTVIDLIFYEGRSVSNNTINNKSKITVIGCINMDIIFNVDRMLSKGETAWIHEKSTLPGGKGANQAIGAAKLNGNVSIIGILGNDAYGKDLYNNLINYNIDVSGIAFDNENPTGTAYIFVSDNGEYCIADYQGATNMLDKNHIDNHLDIIISSKYCLIQNSIPMETVLHVSKICKQNNIKMILKPFPPKEINNLVFEDLYMIVPNENEINHIIDGNMSNIEKAEQLISKGVKNVIMTLGENGCYFTDGINRKHFKATNTASVDTTGASDAFISALAVLLSEGEEVYTAIEYANIAAGISVTRLGAQSSLIDRDALNMYYKEHVKHL